MDDVSPIIAPLNDAQRAAVTAPLVPTLVLAGERDLITPPKNQQIFAELIPYSELCVVSEGAHCSQMEKPELVNTFIRNFLESVARGETPRKARKTKAKPKAKTRGAAARADA